MPDYAWISSRHCPASGQWGRQWWGGCLAIAPCPPAGTALAALWPWGTHRAMPGSGAPAVLGGGDLGCAPLPSLSQGGTGRGAAGTHRCFLHLKPWGSCPCCHPLCGAGRCGVTRVVAPWEVWHGWAGWGGRAGGHHGHPRCLSWLGGCTGTCLLPTCTHTAPCLHTCAHVHGPVPVHVHAQMCTSAHALPLSHLYTQPPASARTHIHGHAHTWARCTPPACRHIRAHTLAVPEHVRTRTCTRTSVGTQTPAPARTHVLPALGAGGCSPRSRCPPGRSPGFKSEEEF